MWFTVLHRGMPIGAVDLAPSGLAAGRLVRAAAYRAIADRVRMASEALLSHGVYGPAVSVITDAARRQARAALRSGASLRLELVPLAAGPETSATFVNLIESSGDARVVVIARFADDASPVPAVLSVPPAAGDARGDA